MSDEPKRPKVIPFRLKTPKSEAANERPSLEMELHELFMQELEKRIDGAEEAEVVCVMTILFFTTSIVSKTVKEAAESIVPAMTFLRDRNFPLINELETMIKDLQEPSTLEKNKERFQEAVYMSGSFGENLRLHPLELIFCPVPYVAFTGSEKIEQYLQTDVARKALLKIKGARMATYLNYGLKK